jgi:choline-sulfatase
MQSSVNQARLRPSPLRRRARDVLVAIALAGLVACGDPGGGESPPASPSALRSRPTIVLILVDTLRADRLGVYGGGRRLAPFIDGMAANGVVFEHAYAPSSWTIPSVASLFTSRYPSQHGAVAFQTPLDPARVTLAEVLAAAGYKTGAIVASSMIANMTPGFDQGFDYFLMPRGGVGGKPDVDAVNEAIFDWLDATAERPVFVYAHYLEPHAPYAPSAAALDRVVGSRPRPDLRAASDAMLWSFLRRPDDARVRAIADVYDAEVATLDDGIEKLFAGLRARGFLNNAFVVFTADHGEELHDHGDVGHGRSLYDEVIHVPLVMARSPALPRRRVPDVVSLVDIAPTVLDVAGVPAPQEFVGHSLRSLLEPSPPPVETPFVRMARWLRPAPAPMAYSELITIGADARNRRRPHELAVVGERTKLIVGVGGERERYDLTHDPGERKRLEGDDPDLTRLEAAARAFRQRVPRLADDAPATELSEDVKERLRALGYVP